MSIVPDAKDWTWVLVRPCPDCDYDARTVDHDRLPAAIEASVGTWRQVLARGDVDVRPDASTWSPLEYACHVRDVYRIFGLRLELMRDEDDPLFDNWDQDRTAIDEDYASQRPDPVADELAEAGHALATAFASVRDDEWARTGRRSDGSSFTVDSLGRYFLHDVVHHAWDVSKARR